MANVIVKVEKTEVFYKLIMDEDTSIWLMGYLQNSIHTESSKDEDNRRDIFKALFDAGVRPL